MILRRFTRHFTEQNWFAVSLDILVVISGIFLGMQVTDWSNERANRQLEKDYMIELYSNFQHNIERAEASITKHEGFSNHEDALGLYLLGGQLDEDRQNELERKRLGALSLSSVDYMTGAYDELVATGEFRLLRDDALRRSLQKFMALRKRTESQLDFFRLEVADRDPILDQSIVAYQSENGQLRTRRDYSPFLGDRDFINALNEASTAHLKFATYRGAELNAAREVLAILACHLGLPECLHVSADQ
jgi:hypothetical protein